jgi:two-component system LytT family response regulator
MKDIIWCTSEGSYTHFFLFGGTKVISSRNLGFYETLLCDNNFCRVHHSSIINLKFIRSYVKGRNSYLVLADGTKLEISQRRKTDFLDRFL